jgi:hypothetical protein
LLGPLSESQLPGTLKLKRFADLADWIANRGLIEVSEALQTDAFLFKGTVIADDLADLIRIASVIPTGPILAISARSDAGKIPAL